MGHTSEEKIKILYEDSLSEIRDLAGRMEVIATTISTAADGVTKRQIIMQRQNESLLIDHVNDVKEAVNRVAAIETNAAKENIHSLQPTMPIDLQVTWLAKHQAAMTSIETFIVGSLAFSGGLFYGVKNMSVMLIGASSLFVGIFIGIGLRSTFLGRLDKTESAKKMEITRRKKQEHDEWINGISKIVKDGLKK
ncbi:MAG: hypothetical protein WC009_07890 [Methylotenera sp.]